MNKVLFVSSSFNQFSFSKSIVSKFVEVNDGVKIEKKNRYAIRKFKSWLLYISSKKGFSFTQRFRKKTCKEQRLYINVRTVIFAAVRAFMVTKYVTLGCSQRSFKAQLLMKN